MDISLNSFSILNELDKNYIYKFVGKKELCFQKEVWNKMLDILIKKVKNIQNNTTRRNERNLKRSDICLKLETDLRGQAYELEVSQFKPVRKRISSFHTEVLRM
jgi:hypothetical protein